jgi:methionine sulfoxide reductase heme-binding subunit
MQPATRSSKRPRGSGDLRRRLLRYHLPLALASGVVLFLFMVVPLFDANKYPAANIFSGTFPQEFPAGQAGPMQHGGNQATPPTGHTPPPGHVPPPGHGGGQTPSPIPTAEQVEDRRLMRRFTTATGYIALALLAFTLLIGPASLLLRRRIPVSSYLRRDVGAWTAVASAVHVIFSLKVHGSGQIRDFLDFFVADGSPLSNSFGLGNWTGLAALVIVAGLLALSSDAALRKLKAKKWKRLQRLNYALFALVVAHAFFYGPLVRPTSPYTILLGVGVMAVLVGQVAGIWLFRRRYSAGEPSRRERQSAHATRPS